MVPYERGRHNAHYYQQAFFRTVVIGQTSYMSLNFDPPRPMPYVCTGIVCVPVVAVFPT